MIPLNSVTQFLATLLGGFAGIAIVYALFCRSRGQLLPATCMAVAIAFTLPIYDCSFAKWKDGIMFLPLLGGLIGGAGWFVGQMIQAAVKKHLRND